MPPPPRRRASARATPRTPKSQETRAHLLEAALALFRKKGFDATSMRDIAATAGLALGATYYYFPTKEALVLAYYTRLQGETAAREVELLATAASLRQRLEIAFATKLEAVRRDRRILVGLTRMVADPQSAIGLFSEETRAVRVAAVASFARAVAPELAAMAAAGLRADEVALLPTALWAAYLGLLLFYFHDRSARGERSAALLAGVLDLLGDFLPLCATPLAAPMLRRLATLAARGGLVVA